MKIGQSQGSKYRLQLAHQSKAEMRWVMQPEAVARGCIWMDFCSFRSLDQSKVQWLKRLQEVSKHTLLSGRRELCHLVLHSCSWRMGRFLLPLVGAFGPGSKLQANPLAWLHPFSCNALGSHFLLRFNSGVTFTSHEVVSFY